MNVQLITKDDLLTFKHELLCDIAGMLSQKPSQPTKYIRSKQVRDLLKISAGTLVNYRIKKLLNPTKVAGVYYYSLEEIEGLLNGNSKP